MSKITKKLLIISAFIVLSILIILSLTSAEKTYHFINIENFAFSPSSLTINQGDVVMWTNYDNTQHTVTSDNYGNLDSLPIDQGNVYSYTFDYPGTYTYHCSIHTNMHGTIIVNSNGNSNSNYNSGGSNYNSNNAANDYYSTHYDYNNLDNYGYRSAYDYGNIINAQSNNNHQDTNTNTDYQNQGYVKVYYYVYYHTPDDYALAYKYVPKKVIYNKGNYPALYEDQENFQVYTYPKNINYPGYGQPQQYTSSSNNQYQITNNYLGMGYLQSSEPSQNLQDTTSEHHFQGDQNSQFQGPYGPGPFETDENDY